MPKKEKIAVIDSRYGITTESDFKNGIIIIRDNRYKGRFIELDQNTAFKLAYRLMSLASEL